MSSTDETQYFLSQDGLRIYYRHWDCENATRICCIVHGFGEHSGRYTHVAEAFNKAGITVFAMDLRGHGSSQGKKGHAKSYDLLMSDIEELLKTARAEFTDLPMFLMGHSMGGNLVANYVIRMNTNELKGFILSSPWFKLAFDPPKWKVKLDHFFSKVYPALLQPSGLEVNHISRIPEVVQAYIDDPMVHDIMSAGLHSGVTEAGEYALDKADSIKLKGLVYQGTADKIIDWKTSEKFASKLDDVEFIALEGVYHEPHNDLNQQEVINLVIKFIQEN